MLYKHAFSCYTTHGLQYRGPGENGAVTLIRTFIAIAVDDRLRDTLAAVQHELRAVGTGVAWVCPAGMHLTLKFLGDVEEARVPEIAAALTPVAAAVAPFTATLAGMGVFPTPQRPRVLWAGITAGAEALVALAAGVDAALTALGFPPEPRPFSPHLTLGRLQAPGDTAPLLARLEAYRDTIFGETPITALTLYRSDLSPRGAAYTALARAPLGTAPC